MEPNTRNGMKRCSSLRHCLAALLPKEAFLEAPDQTEEVARFNAQLEPIIDVAPL